MESPDPAIVGTPATAIDTDLGPAACPYCASIGTGRYMYEHIAEEHPTDVENVIFAVCIGGGLVKDGEYVDAPDAIARALSVKHTLRATEGRDHEPVQILIWPMED